MGVKANRHALLCGISNTIIKKKKKRENLIKMKKQKHMCASRLKREIDGKTKKEKREATQTHKKNHHARKIVFFGGFEIHLSVGNKTK
jgi:hypothetical protein